MVICKYIQWKGDPYPIQTTLVAGNVLERESVGIPPKVKSIKNFLFAQKAKHGQTTAFQKKKHEKVKTSKTFTVWAREKRLKHFTVVPLLPFFIIYIPIKLHMSSDPLVGK